MHRFIIASDEGEWKHNWDDIGEEVLHWCRVQSCERDWCRERMVELMVAGVEPAVVKYAVDVISEDFARYVAEYEMTDNFCGCGEGGRYDEDWAEIGQVSKTDLKGDVGEGDEKAVADTVEDLICLRLSVRVRLVLVVEREGGKEGVDELVDGCRKPKPDKLD